MLDSGWYVSNVSIIFYCSMLLYYPFWMFMGFTLHLYIIFGTNLLTGGPARITVFFAYFSISKKRNIKWSPNGMKPSGAWFLEQTWSRGLGVDVKQPTRRPRGRGRAHPPGRALHPRGPLVAPLTYFFLLYIPTYPHRRAPRKPNSTAATFCTREIPSWGLFRSSARGASITEGSYINTIASPMKCE